MYYDHNTMFPIVQEINKTKSILF